MHAPINERNIYTSFSRKKGKQEKRKERTIRLTLVKKRWITYARIFCLFTCHYMANWRVCPIFVAPLVVWHDKLQNLCGAGQETLRPRNVRVRVAFTRRNVLKYQGKRALNIITGTESPFERALLRAHTRSNSASTRVALAPRYKLFAAVCKTAMRNEQSCHTMLEW